MPVAVMARGDRRRRPYITGAHRGPQAGRRHVPTSAQPARSPGRSRTGQLAGRVTGPVPRSSHCTVMVDADAATHPPRRSRASVANARCIFATGTGPEDAGCWETERTSPSSALASTANCAAEAAASCQAASRADAVTAAASVKPSWSPSSLTSLPPASTAAAMTLGGGRQIAETDAQHAGGHVARDFLALALLPDRHRRGRSARTC